MLIVSLGHGRGEVQQCRATGDTHYDGAFQSLRHAQGIEARTTLVGDGIALDLRTRVEVMHDGCIATARTHHGMTDAMSHEQGGQYVDVVFIAVHLDI